MDRAHEPYRGAAVVTGSLCTLAAVLAIAMGVRGYGPDDVAAGVLLATFATPVALTAGALLVAIGPEWRRRDVRFLVLSLAALVCGAALGVMRLRR